MVSMSPYTTPRAPAVSVPGSAPELIEAATGVAVTGAASQATAPHQLDSRQPRDHVPVCDVPPQITMGFTWLRKQRALWRAVGGDQPGLAGHCLGPRHAPARE